jgi:SAM-dependent methyltransferase
VSVDVLNLQDSQHAGFSLEVAALARVIKTQLTRLPTRVLVVGCGNGRPAAQLAVSLDADVIGVDRQARFDPMAEAYATLRAQNAGPLEFGDGAFDFVYSDQKFEHLSVLRSTLAEMRRVLVRGGGFCLRLPSGGGFNSAELRSELIAAFGDAHDVTQSYYAARFSESDLLSRACMRLKTSLMPSRYFVGRRTDARC